MDGRMDGHTDGYWMKKVNVARRQQQLKDIMGVPSTSCHFSILKF